MMRGKIIFILGGAKSGKSKFACKLTKEENVIFIATAEAKDDEMKKKIKKHKRQRPKNWITLEEPVDIDIYLQKYNNCKNTIIIDCLTLWIANLQLKYKNKEKIKNKINSFLKMLQKIKATLIIVSNEVGLGIVPDNSTSRLYRDLLGELNLNVAKIANEVYYLIAGIPIKVK